MQNSRSFLLGKIAGYEKNNVPSMGEFSARHFEDVAKIMDEFAIEAIITTVNMLVEGKSVDLGNGKTIELEFLKRNPKTKQLKAF